MTTCPDCHSDTQHRRGGGACLERQIVRLREENEAARGDLAVVASLTLDLAHTEALLEDERREHARTRQVAGAEVLKVRRFYDCADADCGECIACRWTAALGELDSICNGTAALAAEGKEGEAT